MPGVATDAAVGQDEVPTPRLVLPVENAEPGTEVPLEVRLPRTGRRLVVQWWLKDLESQERLGGPKVAYHFIPCSARELLGLTEVPLPSEGSRWVLEAMTLDLSSQEQSRLVQLAIGG
jgi:hypothetical protein